MLLEIMFTQGIYDIHLLIQATYMVFVVVEDSCFSKNNGYFSPFPEKNGFY
jgi:hypothetical protein